MKRRTEIILRDILKNKKDLNLMKISTKFSVSERTIENDIIEINNFLGSIGQEYIFFDSDGQLCSVKRMDRKKIIRSLKNYDIKNYKFSKEERMVFIYVLLLRVGDCESMEHIAKMLNVTRITILNDIKVLKDSIDPDINILTYPGKGLKLKIDKYKRIDELNRIFEEISLVKEK
ncbi:MAG: HTH domain-containing protein, partial [Intestinibacter bartlettii]